MNTELVPGKAVPVGAGKVAVHRILCGNAGVMTGPGTNSYLIGTQVLALVDPGPADETHKAALLRALNGRRLGWILATHTHGDHSPGTAALQAATGASVVGMAAPDAGYQDRTFIPDREYQGGDRLDCGEFAIQLIHTPGHVSNHLCFFLEEENMLFTGDHVLQGTTPVILPPDGSMRDYLASLRALKSLPSTSLAPGHGYLITDPQRNIDALIRHRLQREQKVLTGLRELGSCSLDQLVLRVYDDVPRHLLIWAKKTLLAHLIKLLDEDLISQEGDHWELAHNVD